MAPCSASVPFGSRGGLGAGRQILILALSFVAVAFARPAVRFLRLSRVSHSRGAVRGRTMEDLSTQKTDGETAPLRHAQLQELSNEMVRLYKELFGRVPTRVKSSWADQDTVL